MNTSNNTSDDARAAREARVLAVLLGEASPGEIAAVEKLLADDPTLRAWRDELQTALPLLRETHHATGAVPDLRMDEARRTALLATLKNDTGRTAPPDSSTPGKHAQPNIIPWSKFLRQNFGTVAACASFFLTGVVTALLWVPTQTYESAANNESSAFVVGTGSNLASAELDTDAQSIPSPAAAPMPATVSQPIATGRLFSERLTEHHKQEQFARSATASAPNKRPAREAASGATLPDVLEDFTRRDEGRKGRVGYMNVAVPAGTAIPAASQPVAPMEAQTRLDSRSAGVIGDEKDGSANVRNSGKPRTLDDISGSRVSTFGSTIMSTSGLEKEKSQITTDRIQAGEESDRNEMPRQPGYVGGAGKRPVALRENKKAAESPAGTKRLDTLTTENAFSTFSLNVSDAAFRLAYETLQQNRWPDPASIRTEEFVNAVAYNDSPPAPGEAVALTQEQARDPFFHNRNLLRLSVQTASAGRTARQPLNLTLLLDTSGSMERADRQETVRVALHALADFLQPDDTVSVFGFSRTPRLLVNHAVGASAQKELRALVGAVPPEGGTNLELALNTAYQHNRQLQKPGALNRVVLLTDGAANLGDADPAALARIVEDNKAHGTGLDCFGIGFDDYNDTLLETLARHAHGRYAYLNNADEARSDFAEKLAGALQVAAQNVKVQVEFNPVRVNTYRLLGYDKHRLNKEDFRDDTVAAAQLGAAENGTAVYSLEIKPDGTGDIGVFQVRYQNPQTGAYHEREWTIPYDPATPALQNAAPGIQLAAAAALFAEKLEGVPQSQAVSLKTLAEIVRRGNSPQNQKLQIMLEAAQRME